MSLPTLKQVRGRNLQIENKGPELIGRFGFVSPSTRCVNELTRKSDGLRTWVQGVIETMGAWGTGTFQDDTACDVRDSYRDYLGEGMSGPDAKARILTEFSSILGDVHESGVLWMALAAAQWKHGRLDEETKAEALRVIDSGTDLERWNPNSKDYAKRKAALEKLREQITSPQPASRKVSRRILCESRWSEGEVFGYRLLDGRVILFAVIGHRTDKGGTYPVCHLLDWIGEDVPGEGVLQTLGLMPSRSDKRHQIQQIMIVGLKPRSAKRLVEVKGRVTAEKQKIPSTVVFFKRMDEFLREWFLIG